MKAFGRLTLGLGLALASTSAFAADFGIFEEPSRSGWTANLGGWLQVAQPFAYAYEGAETDCEDDLCQTGYGGGFDARFHNAFGNGKAVQWEALVDFHTSLDNNSDESEPAVFVAAGGHWISRSEGRAHGLFAGVTTGSQMANEDHALHGFAGLEGAIFGDTETYFGQVGGLLFLAGTGGKEADTIESLVFVRTGARHFLHENAMIEVALAGGYSPSFDLDDDDRNTGAWVQLAALAEHQLPDNRSSWFVGGTIDYLAAWDESCCDASGWVGTVMVGLRMNVDGGTLHEQSTEGSRTFSFVNLRAPVSYGPEIN